MSVGLDATFRVLTQTNNEAAVGALLSAIDSRDREIQGRSLRALLKRRNNLGQHELLSRWHTLSDRWKTFVTERSGRLSTAIREALAGDDEQLRQNACDAVMWVHEYDLIPVLLRGIEEGDSASELMASTMLTLVESLYEELSAPRNYRNRRDPQMVRQFTVTALEQAMGKFSQHHCVQVIEAFLILATSDNSGLRATLQATTHPAHEEFCRILEQSPRPGVIQLLLGFIEDGRAPQPALDVVSRRSDVTFLKSLLKRVVDEELPKRFRGSLKRIHRLPWLQGGFGTLQALNGDEQAAALRLALLSGTPRLEVFEVVKLLLRQGAAEGRQAAAAALAEFRGIEANELILEAVGDADPIVQVNVVPLLRERSIPGAMSTLLTLLDSDSPLVQDAARASLSEFNFERYITAFDMLDTDVRESTGELVRRVDLAAESKLREELDHSSRTRRFRAIEAAAAMQLVVPIEDKLIAMLDDTDHFIRVAAAEALVGCNSLESRAALRDALLDATPAVQEAAEESLQTLAEMAVGERQPTTSFASGLGDFELPSAWPTFGEPSR